MGLNGVHVPSPNSHTWASTHYSGRSGALGAIRWGGDWVGRGYGHGRNCIYVLRATAGAVKVRG